MISAEDLGHWQQALDRIVRGTPWLRDGVALDSCGSTQDECRVRSSGTPGMLVTTLTQTRGRGRPGRSWDHDALCGLAVTVSVADHLADIASIAAGLAAARAAATHTVGPASARIGVKWPNDVVIRESSTGDEPNADPALRKIAGVLVEAADGILMVGIGLNVRATGVPVAGRTSIEAESLASSPPPDRMAVLVTLIDQLWAHLSMSHDELRARWAEADRLVGLRRGFVCDGREYQGTVLAIDPFDCIRLELEPGRVVAIPSRLATPLDGYGVRS